MTCGEADAGGGRAEDEPHSVSVDDLRAGGSAGAGRAGDVPEPSGDRDLPRAVSTDPDAFQRAGEGWRDVLEWAPAEPVPYLHQLQAWRRLSSLDREPQPTLVTTGTGSGKTEAFLVPVLDHCRRASKAGGHGVKAILLYPMNALATDQAIRINDFLARPELKDVTAGLYIGEAPGTAYARVLTERSEIRSQRPDILITNYKMLDLLLQRGEDLALWQDADIAYVVVDEFRSLRRRAGHRRGDAAAPPGRRHEPLTARQAAGEDLPGRDVRHAR